jgi:purine-binding chemotaxis protein CheW
MQQQYKSSPATPPKAGPMFVTMFIDGQMFGIDVKYVRDVLLQQRITPVPLAPPEVAGSLNLRGRIVTVIDTRMRLGLPSLSPGAKATFVVVELKGELFSLMVDNVGEVITSTLDRMEGSPVNLSAGWKAVSSGIYKLESELLVMVDVQSLLNF